MKITVGIMSAPRIYFLLKGDFNISGHSEIHSGECSVYLENGIPFLLSGGKAVQIQLPCNLIPVKENSSEFELTDVIIGIQFHWERKENQRFRGSLKFLEENGQLTAINELDLEDYLLSVISSEMSATSSLELLKAHAVISRSWLVAQREKSHQLTSRTQPYHSFSQDDEEYIRWFDREDHRNFDVCADDHCQRYQGISRATTDPVCEAINATRGEVLTHNGSVCDARFSKCCGGISETFENVWEPVSHPYLQKVYDAPDSGTLPDLTDEVKVREWILSSPPVFCNTTDKRILSEVLNDYDQETQHFFRWEIYYSREELSRLIYEKTALDFGDISDLTPIERGVSGRLIKLKITGSKKSMIIGKELMIRKALSPTHLYSSAFIVEKETNGGNIKGFRLKGAGWGHGVGLCQIGAAVMGARGYTYRQILSHYFPGSRLSNVK